jgi:heat shock protein HslJ
LGYGDQTAAFPNQDLPMRWTLVVALASVLLIGFSNNAMSAQGKRGATSWVLQKGRDIPSTPARKPTLRKRADKLTGSTGCNNFTATVSKRDGRRIAIEQLALTRMLCEPGQNAIEAAVVAALEQTEFVAERRTTLTFLSAKKAPLLVWKRQRTASAVKHRRRLAAQPLPLKVKRMRHRNMVHWPDCFTFWWR